MYCNLDDYKDAQLILLKGHLMLEVLLSEVVQDKELSFYGKTNKFNNLFNSKFLSDSLLELNGIRNKLAHSWDFKVEESGLLEWSDTILNNIKYEDSFRRTERTKIVHAMTALAGEVYEYYEQVESNMLNKTL